MASHRLSTILALAALSAPAVASADAEVGVIAGAHYFNDNNELGVPDRMDQTSVGTSVLFGLRLGYFFSPVLGIEGELGVIPTEAKDRPAEVTALTYRAHLVAQFGAADAKVLPFVVLGGGAMSVLETAEDTVIWEDTDELLYVGAGLKYRVANSWGLRADLRAVFPPSSQDEFATLDAEALLSVYRELGRAEEEAPPPPPPPPPPADTDGDGLTDDVDQCVNEPEDMDGFQDEDGCPDADNDGDGVADAADDCDAEPEDVDGFADEDGCPDPDNDGDGLPDTEDKCPGEAEDRDNFQDEDGCPDPDNDGDGVVDAADQCPDQLETPNGYQDSDGCPDDVPKAVKRFTGVIKGITFRSNSDVILRSSNRTLDAAVKVLQEYPDLKLEIQGHTDDIADDDYNMELSQRRADAVKAYFVGKGIDEARLIAKGFGETQPVVAKKTRAARAKNRRVEFKLISDLDATGEAPPATQPSEPAPEPAPSPNP